MSDSENDYEIRKLNKNDYDLYIELINEYKKTSFTEEEFVDALTDIKKISEIWVIEEDGNIIATGTIIYEIKFSFNLAKIARIEDIYVKKESRNNNFGKIIMHHLMKQAKKNDCFKIVLEATPETSEFYLKCGYKQKNIQMTRVLPNI